MLLTDTHAHLYLDAFDEDRREMMRRAQEAGVGRFFLPGIDSTYLPAMKRFREEFPGGAYLMCGLHPTHVGEGYEAELAVVEAELAGGGYVAVGETGIDLYWDTSRLREQQDAFARQIRMAKKYELPIVIHCREAFDEIFAVLEAESHPGLRGIFHCFTGTLEQAHRAISFNMKLGIGGVVTYKNGQIDRFLHQIAPEHIVLETDAPYLAPVPFRGKRNESAYLSEVLRKVAGLYGLPEADIARITTANSMEVFGC